MHIISVWNVFICLFLKNDKGNWNSGVVTYWEDLGCYLQFENGLFLV